VSVARDRSAALRLLVQPAADGLREGPAVRTSEPICESGVSTDITGMSLLAKYVPKFGVSHSETYPITRANSLAAQRGRRIAATASAHSRDRAWIVCDVSGLGR